jgi:hypothetical protein
MAPRRTTNKSHKRNKNNQKRSDANRTTTKPSGTGSGLNRAERPARINDSAGEGSIAGFSHLTRTQALALHGRPRVARLKQNRPIMADHVVAKTGGNKTARVFCFSETQQLQTDRLRVAKPTSE